ncbi:MAG: YraN family protein [Marinifilaceae bacterium]
MAEHNDTGIAGEECAVSYLLSQGYKIRHKNWRCGHLELDIVCERGNYNKLIVVEVKTRKNKRVRLDELIDFKKVNNIRWATDAYIRRYDIRSEVQIDVIVVTGEEQHLEHLQNIISVID